MSDPIIEAAVTALLDSQGLTVLGRATAVLAAVTPLIKAAALEEAGGLPVGMLDAAGIERLKQLLEMEQTLPLIEARTLERAAKVAEERLLLSDFPRDMETTADIAAAIRALKEQP